MASTHRKASSVKRAKMSRRQRRVPPEAHLDLFSELHDQSSAKERQGEGSDEGG